MGGNMLIKKKNWKDVIMSDNGKTEFVPRGQYIIDIIDDKVYSTDSFSLKCLCTIYKNGYVPGKSPDFNTITHKGYIIAVRKDGRYMPTIKIEKLVCNVLSKQNIP